MIFEKIIKSADGHFMQNTILIFICFFLCHPILHSQEEYTSTPPISGPGSPTYIHDEIVQYDFAQKPHGYWLFEPAAPRPDSANVIVFSHGYGGYNPMIYGQWIKHLVRKGNIVIYPRYQRNMYFPRPRKFSKNVSRAIRDALEKIETGDFVKPITQHLALVGHSYGGVVSADLAVNFEKHNIPKPVAVLLCSPGTGPLRGGILKSYQDMPTDIKLIVIVSKYDRTVGDKFGKKVFETATEVVDRNFIRQYPDGSISPPQNAGHNESYALDRTYDNGKRNFTSRRALRIGKTNNMDYYGYWKIFDALLDCSRSNENCKYAFGNTPEQRFMGLKNDGVPVRELEVILPPMPLQVPISSQ